MPASDFAMPEAVVLDEATATPTYGLFIAEPWEKGFGYTIGNALRRVLLSSLEGTAVSSVRIDGVKHEFSTIPDVIEDVTEVVLNLKKLRFRCQGETPRMLELYADKAGPVTGADIREDGVTQVLNPELVICTLDKDRPVRMEIEITKGRGYRSSDENKREDQPVGVIPIDSLFSPVSRVAYDVQACRVGQRTDYDRLDLRIWTDGRLGPQEALKTAALILREHVSVFAEVEDEQIEIERTMSDEDRRLLEMLAHSVNDMELSVRAKNCLNSAGIRLLGELVQKTDSELLQYRNFGRKSLEDIKKKLAGMELSLGMTLHEDVATALERRLAALDGDTETQQD